MRGNVSFILALVACAASSLNASLVIERTFTNLNLPLFDLDTRVNLQTLDVGDATIDHLRVSLDLSGRTSTDHAFNGDYFISVANSGGGYAVLANRVGRSDTKAFGYGDNGLRVMFDDAASNDIHRYRETPGATPVYPAPVLGAWQPSGRVALPEQVTDLTSRTAMLSSFNSKAVNGDWWLTVEDTSGGGVGMLKSWGVRMQVTPGASAELRFADGDRIETSDGGDLVLSNDFQLTGQTTFVGTGGLHLQGQLRGTGTLVHEGSGTLELSEGSDEFLGSVEIRGGKLRITNSTGSATGGGDVLIADGGTLTGTGRIDGLVTFGEGSFIAPGASPGTQTFGSDVTWEGGATYLWEINNADGTMGVDPGWDWVDVAGQLELLASAENPFIILIASLDPFNAPGAIAGFDGLVDYVWTIATAESIAGFDPDHIEIDASDFNTSHPTAGGTFSVVESGGNINLLYSPIPEPGTYVLGAGLCALFVVVLRRRTRGIRRSGVRR